MKLLKISIEKLVNKFDYLSEINTEHTANSNQNGMVEHFAEIGGSVIDLHWEISFMADCDDILYGVNRLDIEFKSYRNGSAESLEYDEKYLGELCIEIEKDIKEKRF